MMKKQIKLTSTLALALLLISSLTMAQSYGKQRNRSDENYKVEKQYRQAKHMHRGGQFFENLDLTEEQKTSIESLKVAHQKKVLPLKNELGEKKAKMRTLSTAENVDMKAIDKLIEEMGAIKVEMHKERAAQKQAVRQILTDEQRVMFDSHKRQMRNKGRGCR